MRNIFDLSRVGLISITALVLVGAQIVSAQTLPVIGDAHVSSAFPSVNFGPAPLLQVGATAGAGTTQAYLQFDLTTLPAGTNVANITKVNLILFVNRIGTAGTLQVAEAAGSWTEGGLTNSNAPGAATSVGTIALPANSDFVTVDVTNSVVAWLSSTRTNNGFVISASGAAVYLDSKESVTTSHAAILSFQQAGPQGATGATGTNGSNGATGATGTNGSNGATGATGTNGSNGATGATGAASTVAGPAGPSGAPGTAGATGVTGVTGATGPSTINYVCNTTCTQNTLQVLVTSGTTSQTNNATTAQQNGIVGIAAATASEGQTVPVTAYGTANCVFENQVFAGDYVQVSGIAAGNCKDVGSTYPTTSQIIGFALSSGNAGSTQNVFLFGVEIRGSGGAGGATGATGSNGAAGATGATGSNGAAGATGATGSNGAAGATGATGSNGAAGATGATGSNGAAGATGAAGSNGAAGATGSNGAAGATGPAGTVAAGSVAQMLVASLSSLGTTGTFSVGVTGSTPIAATTNETFEEEVVSSSGTLSNMFLRVIVGTANAYQLSVTLYKNGSPTAITCSTVATPATALSVGTCSDTTHTVNVVAGDSLAYVFQPSASNTNNKISVAIHIQ